MKRIGEIAVTLLLGLVVGHLVFFAAISALCFALAFLQRPACIAFDPPRAEEDRRFLAERIARLEAAKAASESSNDPNR